MDKRISIAIWCTLFLVPATASAYVGPGAGLSLLGALWALLVALATALVFIVAWPVRRMLKRRRSGEAEGREAKERAAANDRREEDRRRAVMGDAHGEEVLPSKRP